MLVVVVVVVVVVAVVVGGEGAGDVSLGVGRWSLAESGPASISP